MLQSSNLRNKTRAAKLIQRNYPDNERLLNAVSRELLKGYKKPSSSRGHNEAYGYMCHALGASGKTKYRPTLERVAKGAGSRKLKGYAKKNLKRLR